MALKKQYKSKYGLTAENAYHRIQRVRGNQSTDVSYDVEIYLDQESRAAGAMPLEIERRTVPQELRSSLSVTHEIYEVLKKEPGYDGYAVDVFESGVFPHFYTSISGGFILKTTVSDGSYNDLSRTISGGTLEGKILINGQVVLGTFRDAQAEKVMLNGYGDVVHGYVNYANADGYVVQVLLGD